MKNNLKTEIAYFNAHRMEYLKEHEGEYALIIGEKLIGFYEDILDAYHKGKSLTDNCFLLKEVIEKDPVILIRSPRFA